jgi:hypothetical protein
VALLNSSLASGLGRPDLAYQVQSQSSVATLTPPTAGWMSAGNEASIGGFAGAISDRAPTVTLFLLVAGLAAFVYWVHPHLA